MFIGFIISGFIAMLTALVFAEFAATIPKSGSAYVYTYATFGELPAWMIGWNQLIRYGGCVAPQARGFAEYLMILFVSSGCPLPNWTNKYELFGIEGSPLAVLFVISMAILNSFGTKFIDLFNKIVTSGKLFILGFLVVYSITLFRGENFDPFLIEDKGWEGVIEASTILFFGYLGFDCITTVAEESIDPKKDVPKAIVISTLLSMVIYATVAFSVQGVGKMQNLGSGDGETALAEVFTDRGAAWMSFILFVCALLGVSAVGMTNMMSNSRVCYSYAKDGLFFSVF